MYFLLFLIGNDLTPEAALTKLCYVLSKDEWDLNTRRKMIQTNLAGEMTVLDIQKRYSSSKSILEHQDGEDQDLIMAIAQQLKVKTSEEMDAIKEVLFPSILCAAVYTGQTAKLELLKSKYDAGTLDVLYCFPFFSIFHHGTPKRMPKNCPITVHILILL